MTTATMTLTEFLLARIAEDQESAAMAVGRGIVWPRLADAVAEHDVNSGWHVVHWNPARVLAECEAKRRLVALADEASGIDVSLDGQARVGARDLVAEPYLGDQMLRTLAAVYADHPDYREEWRP